MRRSDRAHQGGGQGERMPAPAYQDWVTLTGLGECTGESRRETSHRRAREDMGQQAGVRAFKYQDFGESWCKLKRTTKKHKHTQAREASILVHSHHIYNAIWDSLTMSSCLSKHTEGVPASESTWERYWVQSRTHLLLSARRERVRWTFPTSHQTIRNTLSHP